MAHVQVRNVPAGVHRRLRARARAAGMSLSDYLLDELTQLAERPSLEEWAAAVRSGKHLAKPKTRPADVVRAERDVR